MNLQMSNFDNAELLAYQLIELGYEQVAIYSEGIEGWIDAGKKVVKGKANDEISN